MQEKNVVISISLMVSNSIEYIERCMESLVPLLNNVSSELIVVDTGGTDGSIDIAKKYANLVVPFEWCNDFAKARNAGLMQAKGEWFMFLDDDEWFEDVSEIIQFFNSGEYKNYNCASYLVRNYQNFEGTEWSEARTIRLTKLTTGTQFVSAIHEYIDMTSYPEKLLNVFVHHYGYVYKSAEEKRKHFNRNATLIKKLLKEEPHDYRLRLQLVQEYISIGEYQLAEDESLACIWSYNDYSMPNVNYVSWMVCNIVLMEISKGDHEKAFDYINSYVTLKWLNDISKLQLMYLATVLCNELHKAKEGICAANSYLEIFDVFSENESKRRNEIVLSQGDYLTEKARLEIIVLAIVLSVDDKDYLATTKYVNKLLMQKSEVKTKQGTRALAKFALWQNEIKLKHKVMDYIISGKHSSKLLIADIDGGEFSDAEIANIAELLAEMNEETEICNQFSTIHSFVTGADREYLEEVARKTLVSSKNPMELCAPFWRLLETIYIDYNACLPANCDESWVEKVVAFLSGADESKVKSIYYAIRKCEPTNSAFLFLKAKCAEYILLHTKKENDSFDFEIVKEFTENTINLYSYIYRDGAECGELASLLPSELRFAYILRKAEEYRKIDLPKYTEFLKEGVKLYPAMAELCKNLILMSNKENEKDNAEKSEFLGLAHMVKNKIVELYDMHFYEEALSAIKQYKLLIPEDNEILILEHNIVMKLQ